MELKQLLVVLDPTHEDKQPSLERAAWVAERSGAALELIVCEHNPALEGGFFFDGPAQEKARNSLLANRKKWLEKLAEPLKEKGLTVNCESRWGKPLSKMVIQRVKELQPDIVFRDATTHSLLERLFLNNTSWQLIRHCPVPLWLSRDSEWCGKKLCAAVDPGHLNDTKNELDHHLIQVAQYFEQTLKLEANYLHTYAPFPKSLIFDATLAATYDQQVSAGISQHKQRFAELFSNYNVADERKHLIEGFAENAIPEFVEQEEVDLLVIGAIARGSLETALIGHTAERVLEEANCDLLIMRHPNQRFA